MGQWRILGFRRRSRFLSNPPPNSCGLSRRCLGQSTLPDVTVLLSGRRRWRCRQSWPGTAQTAVGLRSPIDTMCPAARRAHSFSLRDSHSRFGVPPCSRGGERAACVTAPGPPHSSAVRGHGPQRPPQSLNSPAPPPPSAYRLSIAVASLRAWGPQRLFRLSCKVFRRREC